MQIDFKDKVIRNMAEYIRNRSNKKSINMTVNEWIQLFIDVTKAEVDDV